MDEVKAGIKYAFQTDNQWTVCVSGTGKQNLILKFNHSRGQNGKLYSNFILSENLTV